MVFIGQLFGGPVTAQGYLLYALGYTLFVIAVLLLLLRFQGGEKPNVLNLKPCKWWNIQITILRRKRENFDFTNTQPTEGVMTWYDTDIVKSPDTLRAVLGYLPQDFGVYPNLTGVELLEYMAAIKGMDAKSARRRIDELLVVVNLVDAAKRPLGGSSGGMKPRAGIGWLRGGLGNVVYFFLFIMVIVMLGIPVMFGASPSMDLVGMGILSNSMSQAAQAVSPNDDGSFNITWLVPEFKTFLWNGIVWTSDIVISRLVLILFSIGIAALSAVFFDRFNPSRLLPAKRTKTAWNSPEPAPAIEATPASNVHLTPLTNTRTHFRFDALFIAELKLLHKGQRGWWYAIAVGLVAAQLSAPPDVTHGLLVIARVWPILFLSGLGCRASRFDTNQIVFSAPRPISILGWLTGALFIPSSALALGALTGSSKAFEVLYVLWMYMLTQKVPMFDFIGMTPASPLYIYMPLAFALMALSIIARQVQLKSR